MADDASKSRQKRLVLHRRFGWQGAAVVQIALALLLLVGILSSDSGTSLPVNLIASILPLLLLVLGIAFFILYPIPMLVEVSSHGLRAYRGKRLIRDVPWEDVQWVASGVWSVGVFTPFTRTKAQCLLVRGLRPWRSVALDSVTYTLTREEVLDFANAVVASAESRSISVRQRPYP